MSNNSRSRHGSGKSNSNAGSNTSGNSSGSFRGKSDPLRLGASAFMGKKKSQRDGSQDGSSPSFSPISPASPSKVPPEFLPPKHRSTQTSVQNAHKATQVPSSASTVSSLDTTSTATERLRTLPRFGAEDAQSVGSGAASSDVPDIAVTQASSEAGRTTHDANIGPPTSSSPAGVRSPSVQSVPSSFSGSRIEADGVSSPSSGSTISGNKKLPSPTASVRIPVPAPTPPGRSVARHHSSTSASRGQPRSPAESVRSPVPAPTPPGNKPSSDASHHIGASRDQPRSPAGPDVGPAGSASRSVHGDEDTHSEQEPKSKGKGKATKGRRSRSNKNDKEHGPRLITNEFFSEKRTKTRTLEFDPRTGQIDMTSNSDPDVQRDHKRELEPERKEGEERKHGHRTEKTSSRRSSTSWEFRSGPNRRTSLTRKESTEDTTEYKRSR